MTLYEFVCETCETLIEKEIPVAIFGRQHGKKAFFICPECEGNLKLKFSSAGVQFKGNDFVRKGRK